ncbi:MAG TPA: hypothetical protein VFV34_07090, partial [Blastocatellia bacterium]|nr:hypothetical protein [Blastocatellia bacterium]
MTAIAKSALWVTSNIAALGVMLLVVWALGNLFLRRIEFASNLERWVFTTVLGFGVAGLLLFGLASVGLLHKSLLRISTGAGTIITVAFLIRAKGFSSAPVKATWKKLVNRPRLSLCIGFAALIYWLLLLIPTQYPPANWDSTAYHLVLARSFLNHHRIVVEPGIPVPVTPSLNHMLFSWAMGLRSDVLAQMVEHAFMMLTGLGLYACGRRQGSRPLGFAAAALWVSHPLVLWLGESAYVDMGLAAFVFTGLYALRLSRDEQNPAFFYLAMTLLGAAAGTKLPGLFFVGLSAGLGLYSCLRSRLNIRQWALGCLLALVVLAPFYIFIYLETGNPLWPTMAEYSKGVWSDPKVVQWNLWIRSIGLPRSFFNFLLLPFRIAFSPDLFAADNHLGFSRLLLVWPASWVIAFFDRSVRWWAVWALLFCAFWFMSSQQLRFLVPAIPIMGLALFESFEWAYARLARQWSARPPAIALIAVALILVAARTQTILAGLAQKGLPPASQAWREKYLAARSGYAAVRYINDRCDSQDTVYVVYGGWLNYYFNLRVIDYHGLIQNGPAPAYTGPAAENWTSWLAANGVNWIYVFHTELPPHLKPPTTDPGWRPSWSGFSLVYEDSDAWVLRSSGAALQRRGVSWSTRFDGDRNYAEALPRQESIEPAKDRRHGVDQLELQARELSAPKYLSVQPPAGYRHSIEV